MSKSRASIFEETGDLDISGFTPKAAPDTAAPPAEKVRAVAEAANFRSREAKPPKSDARLKREPRVYRTGRNVQFNIKATQATVDAFYSLTEQQGWVLGDTLDRAIKALKQQLESAR